MSPAFVRILGAVRFTADDGETIDLPSASQRRLLAALALAAGATLRPEYLSDLLDVSPGALRTAVSRLRARLGEETICTDAVGYRVTCAVDATRFTDLLVESPGLPDRLAALDDALALWDGEALDEFRHEPWADAEATRLDELRCVAIEDRAELLAGRGRAGEAVAALEAHIATQPLRDRARGLLMKALASDGRQADALRAYQDYRNWLAEETGTEPSALVRSIERRVAAGWSGDHDDADDGQSAAVDAPTRARWNIPLPGALTRGAELIGRRRELTWLESELVQARSGTFRVVVLSGEAGIGKTTLLGAFAREHGVDGTNGVVYGRCDDGAAVPLQPFRDVVGALVDGAPDDALVANCERYGGELTRIVPRLASRVWAPPPTTGDEATERYQLFESIADLLRRLAATGPVILMLDDLHWAEPTALLLLRHLSRALADTPVLVVASIRDTEEQSAEVLATLADLERGHARRISLVGFDDAELSDLVTAVTDAPNSPTDAVLEQLRDLTAGNPLYAVQLVRHLVESGQLVVDDGLHLSGGFAGAAMPASLLDVVLSRVRALGAVTHDVLRAGSVLGIEFDEDTLAEMTDAGDDEVTASLDAALAAGLLVETDETPPTMRFAHTLVAHALYSELRGPGRRRLHERAARVLQKRTDELPQKVVVELARHCAHAGDLQGALRWATAAGDYALEHLAPSEAASWYDTALAHADALNLPEPARADLMVRRGVAQSRAGHVDARQGLFEAAEMARRSGADDVLIRAALATDRGLTRLGAVDAEQIAIIEAAIDVADPSDTSTYARLLALHALELVATPNFELRQERARRAMELIDASADPTLLLQTMAPLTFALEGPGTLARRRELAVRAVSAALAIDDPFLQFWTSRAAYFVAIESADPQLAASSLERMRAISADVGEPRLQWVTAIYDTFDATMRARLDDAERFSELELDVGLRIGEPDAFSLYAGQLFVMRSFAGRYDELLPLVEGIMDANPGILPFRLAYGIICLAVDRRDDAHTILHEGAAAGFSSLPRDYLWMTSAIGFAVMAIDLQDVEMAAQLYPLLLPYSDEVAFSGVSSQGPISAYLGKLASLMGDHGAADEYLQHALDITVAFGWEYHRATTLVALALSQQRRTGALDDDANAWLDEASAIGVERDLQIVLAQVATVRG